MFFEAVQELSEQYRAINNDIQDGHKKKMPSNAYFINNGSILCIPGDEGDCRYPYGYNGLNFWSHGSGYMHCNDGLFSVFMKAAEGQEPKIAFFAGIKNNSGHMVLPLLPVPIKGWEKKSEVLRYTVFSRACVYYITETRDIRFSIRGFPEKSNTLHFTVGVENLSQTRKNLFVSSYMNPFLKHDLFENSENRWFREVKYQSEADESSRLGSFIIKVNEDLNRTSSIFNIGTVLRSISLSGDCSMVSHEETTSRYEYVGGNRGSLHFPAALYEGHFSAKKKVCAFTEIGAAGDIIHLDIGAGASVRYDIEFRYTTNCIEERSPGILFSPVDIIKADKTLECLETEDKLSSESLDVEFSDAEQGFINPCELTPFFYHLMKQVRFCSLIKGYVQLSPISMIGIRDIFQALEGLILWKPGEAKKKMLEALGFVLADGRCPRQYTLPQKKGLPVVMDLRPFIDQGSWVISAVSSYLKLTGDINFLNENCRYYKEVDNKKGMAEESGEKGSVLEHLVRIIDYLLSNRDFDNTGCIRVLYGDWNDALDGLGVSSDPEVSYGTGVSVMASLHVFQNLTDIIGILQQVELKKYSSRINQYVLARNELEDSIKKYAVVADGYGNKRIIHGWGDKRSYMVGSFSDSDGKSRYSLTANAFWVLSGIDDLNRDMGKTVLEAFEALDSKYGYKTFEPHFQRNTPGVGRIPRLPGGTAENGAVYIHASTFAVMALFRMGKPEKAWEQIQKLLPFTHGRISCSPYVMPNSYGYNEELGIDGESMNDWQTGSSNMMLKIFIRYVFGIRPEYGCLFIQPAVWCPFKRLNLKIIIRSCHVTLEYTRSGAGERKYFINGNIRESEYDEAMRLERLRIPWEQLRGEGLNIRVED